MRTPPARQGSPARRFRMRPACMAVSKNGCFAHQEIGKSNIDYVAELNHSGMMASKTLSLNSKAGVLSMLGHHIAASSGGNPTGAQRCRHGNAMFKAVTCVQRAGR